MTTTDGVIAPSGWRKILCATDLSAEADLALDQAASLAVRDGAELHVFHALPLELTPGISNLAETPAALLGPMDAALARARQQLEARLAALPGDPARRELSVQVAAIPIYAAIVNQAEAVAADLVVVGSHGSSGLRRTILGSTAEKVTRYAHAAVLVTRPPPLETDGTVLVGTDLSDPALPAIRTGTVEAARRGARLVIAHCFDVPPETAASVSPQNSDWGADLRAAAEGRLRHAVAGIAPGAELRVLDGPAAQALEDLAHELSAALVVLGTRGRTGLRRMLLGSTAEHVVRRVACSVLVVPLHPASE